MCSEKFRKNKVDEIELSYIDFLFSFDKNRARVRTRKKLIITAFLRRSRTRFIQTKRNVQIEISGGNYCSLRNEVLKTVTATTIRMNTWFLEQIEQQGDS